MTPELLIRGVPGLPEIRAGDDIAALLAEAAPTLADGDIVVITSKVVSKAEGKVRTTDRDAAIDAETARVVARRGTTRIVQTRHGFVLAAAGVDASNTEPGTVVLLPDDPDASARRIRVGLRERLGVTVAVVVSDTFGRPWRNGLTDNAIGVAGVDALDDLRGQSDKHGNELDVTVTCVADEVAAAADLAKGKLAGFPAAVVRGLADRVTAADGTGIRPVLRAPEEDMFRYGSRDVVTARRTIRDFSAARVDPAALRRAIGAAVTAPAPHGATPWRFVLVESLDVRKRLLDAMLAGWVTNLRADGLREEEIEARTRWTAVLRHAPTMMVPCLDTSAVREYPDPQRAAAERKTFVTAMGASVENLLIALWAEGLGSCWTPSTVFHSDVAARELDLPGDWEPMGAIGVGHPTAEPDHRPPRDPAEFVILR